MKRKLSLLLSLMMVLTLIPMSSFAATDNRVDRVVSVTSNGDTLTNSPNLVITNNKGDMKLDQSFRIELGENAEWGSTYTSAPQVVSAGVISGQASFSLDLINYDHTTNAASSLRVNGTDVVLNTTYAAQVDAITDLANKIDQVPFVNAVVNGTNIDVTGTNGVTIALTNITGQFVGEAGFTTTPYAPTFTGDAGVLHVRRISNRRLEVTIVSEPDTDAVFTFPLAVDFSGASEGAQQVTVVPLNSGVTGNSYTFATVGAGEVVLKVDSKTKISRTGNQTVNLILDEIAIDSFKSDSQFTLRLPRNFSWGTVTDSGTTVTRTVGGTDNRDLTITTTGADSSRIQSVFIEATVVPNRDARFGDVDVTVVRGTVSPSVVTVAEYVDFVGMVSVDKVLDVVSGKNEDALYVAKVIVEEPVAGTLLNNRYIEFSLNKDNAALEHNETLKVTRKAGASQMMEIDTTSSPSLNNGTPIGTNVYQADIRTIVTNSSNEIVTRRDSHAWDMKVVGTSTNAARYEIEVPFVVSAGFEGDVVLNVKGAGIDSQDVVIAKATKPVTVKIDSDGLADVKIGLQSQSAPDIIITETEAGALTEGVIYTITNRFADAGIIWRTATVEVIEGDLELRSSTTGRRDNGARITVDSRSTKASTIKISGVQVTLDRTVPFGPFEVDFNFGDVANQHDNLGNRVARLPYFNVVTPVQDNQRMTAVFTIGDANYTVNGEAMTLDAAPFISNNRTMLPIGAIAQVVGASVNYSPVTRTAIFTKDGVVVSMTLDQPFLTANGVVIPMDSAPVVVNSRAFVPMAFVAQAFGVPVQYDAAARTVTVN